jgi:hypothetical protein
MSDLRSDRFNNAEQVVATTRGSNHQRGSWLRVGCNIRWRDEPCGLDLEGSGEVISPDAASLEIDPEPTPILTHV